MGADIKSIYFLITLFASVIYIDAKSKNNLTNLKLAL